MIGDILPYVVQHQARILTSITLILLGGWLFEARDGFFLSGGRFRGKIAGLLLLLTSVIAVAVSASFIDQFWLWLVSQYEASKILGIVIITGMIAVNNLAEWNYLDSKSLIVYLIGFILLVQPVPISGLF